MTADATPSFKAPNKGAIIGIGWNRFTTVFSTGDGVIFGRDAAGDLWWHQDLAQDGTIRWEPGAARESARLSTPVIHPGFQAGSMPTETA